IGLILLAMEIFVIPGFGIAGVSGIICVAAGLILSMLDNDLFNFDHVNTAELNRSVLTVVVGIFAGFALMIYLTHKIGHGIFRFLALTKTQEISEGYLSVNQKEFSLIGKEGVAKTMLRPSGKVIVDSISYDAISIVGYIDKGTPVKVIRYESGQIYVQKTE
ncbi:MAG TPA: NfeD family protein, partial [Bacteroidales bacterium]